MFFKQLLNSVLANALNGAAAAQNSGADLKTVGVAAGITALAGVLQFLLQHPVVVAQQPVVAAAMSAVKPVAV